MEKERRFEAKDAALGFLILYFSLGTVIFAAELSDSDQIFPVYAWTLFRSVPLREATVVQVRIISVGGDRLEKPLDVADAREYVRPVPFGDNNSVLIAFERAYRHGDEEELRDARRSLERRFIPARVGYEVVRRTYDTIAFWKTGEVENEKVLGRFESGAYE